MVKNNSRKREPIHSLIKKINGMDNHNRNIYAQKCGTSLGNLKQIAYGFGGVSPKLAKTIIRNCDCDITLQQLIPELA